MINGALPSNQNNGVVPGEDSKNRSRCGKARASLVSKKLTVSNIPPLKIAEALVT